MIIGIGGVSRAGKSVLSEQLKAHFEKKGRSVKVFSQDGFVKPKISIQKVEGVPDWERPNTIKWESLSKAIERSSADVNIVEGLFSFYPASLRITYDLKIFVEIGKELFTKRKAEDKRWEEEPEWYAEHVWKSYLKYGQPKGDKAEYIMVNGELEFDVDDILAES